MGIIHSALLVSLLMCGCSTVKFDAGFIASRYQDCRGEVHTKALGPLYESAKAADGRQYRAFRPFFSSMKSEVQSKWIQDYLWPLGMVKGNHDEVMWRFLTAVGTRSPAEDDKASYRTWLLPFYYQGRSKEGEGYMALFPLGGKICEFLGRDRITFFLFPIYASSQINDVKATSVLWPVYSRTKGEGIDRFRVFPIYGRSQLQDEYDKRFIFWPFWTSADYFHEGAKGSGYLFFPFWGHLKLEDQESWMLLPPLFRVHRGEKQNLLYAPWPFIQKSSGEVDKLYIWPLWGRKKIEDVKTGFFLWPIFRTGKIASGQIEKTSFKAVPFLSTRKVVRKSEKPDIEAEVISRDFTLWPLCSYRRKGDDSVFRLLHLFPGGNAPPVERNWAPFWTLYSRSKVGEERESELLWGLYRSRRKPEESLSYSLFPLFSYQSGTRGDNLKEWSILKGLLGYKRIDESRCLRLFYLIKFRNKEPQP